VLVGSGYDGSQEELYHAYRKSVLERGWNFATYEGPGQPTVRRQQNIGFRPQWWEAVTPVVDYSKTRPDIDMSKVALVGVSYGGLLDPLAATQEHRFSAVLAIDGAYSLYESLIDQFPPSLITLFNSGNKTAFDSNISTALKSPTAPSSLRWGVEQGEFAFNTTSAYEWVAESKNINLTAETIKEVKDPVFVGSGQNDTSFPGQAETVAKWLGDQAYYYHFHKRFGSRAALSGWSRVSTCCCFAGLALWGVFRWQEGGERDGAVNPKSVVKLGNSFLEFMIHTGVIYEIKKTHRTLSCCLTPILVFNSVSKRLFEC
jgi:dienelactone hydrolase